MNCQEFWDTMPELGEGDTTHALECPACAALLERQRALANGLRATAAGWTHIQAPSRVEGRLVNTFRSHNGMAPERRVGFWFPILTWVAATAAIVALAAVLVRDRRPEPAQRRTPNRLELAAASAAGNSYEDSVYTSNGFVPLPNAERIEPDEDVNMVRVELPRSSMIALGYTVSPERSSELVEADVVLGADGVARAVRFLDN